MRRRAFLYSVAGGLLAAAPVAAQSPGGPPLIGFLPLGAPSNPYDRSLVEAFREGLREAGVVENRDLVLEVVWTNNELEVSQAVVRLVQRGAKLLIPVGTTALMTVKRQAPTTSILFISVGNPLGIGLVESLSRPGGHVTGFGDFLAELSSKYVQFALEVGKPPGVVDYLWHAGWTDGQYRLQRTEEAAQSLNVKLRARAVANVSEVDEAMAGLRKAGASVVIVQPSPFTFLQRDRFPIELGHRERTGHDLRVPARGFGRCALITYGPDYVDLNRPGRGPISAGSSRAPKPGDLPGRASRRSSSC